MPKPLSAYYGRDTYAHLTCCAVCGKRYDGRDGWHTVKGSAEKVDAWWLLCDECYGKEGGDGMDDA